MLSNQSCTLSYNYRVENGESELQDFQKSLSLNEQANDNKNKEYILKNTDVRTNNLKDEVCRESTYLDTQIDFQSTPSHRRSRRISSMYIKEEIESAFTKVDTEQSKTCIPSINKSVKRYNISTPSPEVVDGVTFPEINDCAIRTDEVASLIEDNGEKYFSIEDSESNSWDIPHVVRCDLLHNTNFDTVPVNEPIEKRRRSRRLSLKQINRGMAYLNNMKSEISRESTYFDTQIDFQSTPSHGRSRRISSMYIKKETESAATKLDIEQSKTFIPSINNVKRYTRKYNISSPSPEIDGVTFPEINDCAISPKKVASLIEDNREKYFSMEDSESNSRHIPYVVQCDVLDNSNFDTVPFDEPKVWRRRSRRLSLKQINGDMANLNNINSETSLEACKSESMDSKVNSLDTGTISGSMSMEKLNKNETETSKSENENRNNLECIYDNLNAKYSEGIYSTSSDNMSKIIHEKYINGKTTPEFEPVQHGDTWNNFLNSSDIDSQNYETISISYFISDDVRRSLGKCSTTSRTKVVKDGIENEENTFSGIHDNSILANIEDCHFEAPNINPMDSSQSYERKIKQMKDELFDKNSKPVQRNNSFKAFNSIRRNLNDSNETLMKEIDSNIVYFENSDDFEFSKNYSNNSKHTLDKFIPNGVFNAGSAKKCDEVTISTSANNDSRTRKRNLYGVPSLEQLENPKRITNSRSVECRADTLGPKLSLDPYNKSEKRASNPEKSLMETKHNQSDLGLDSEMDIDDQLDSLHLSEPSYSKRRRLSGISNRKETPIPPNNDSDSLGSPHSENISILREENGSLSDMNEKPSVRRSGRKKSAPVRWDGKNNLLKNSSPSSDNLAAIEKYYLDKTIKKTTTSLETIFEETRENKSSLRNIMSVRKLRRSINFSEKVHPGKIKKRQLKASKTNSRKKLLIESSLEDLHKKLLMIEQDHS